MEIRKPRGFPQALGTPPASHSSPSPDDESIILSQLEITKHNFYVTPEVTELRQENDQLKQVVAEILLKNRFLKKTLNVADSESIDI